MDATRQQQRQERERQRHKSNQPIITITQVRNMRPEEEPCPDVKLSLIEGAGLGLFAEKDYQPGEFIAWYNGKFFGREDVRVTLRDPTYVMSFNNHVFVDAMSSDCKGKRANHSTRPNATVSKWEDRDGIEKLIWLRAGSKGIKAESEITINYGNGHWKKMDEYKQVMREKGLSL